MLESLAAITEQDLITELTKGKFYGLQVDETTDVGSEKQLSIYITYMTANSIGNLKTASKIRGDWTVILELLVNDKSWKTKVDREQVEQY